MNTTRSALVIASQVSSVPPLEPTTPTQAGFVSASEPWPEIEVATGMSSRFAKRSSAAIAPAITTPPPQTISGRLAERIASSAASAAPGCGRLRIGGVMAELAIRPDIGGIDVVVLDIVGQPEMATSRERARGHGAKRCAHHARNVFGLADHRVPLGQGRISAS